VVVASADDLRPFIRDIPDFPRPGVTFRDITPLLGDAVAFRAATELLVAPFDADVTKVVGIEARGFILAAPIALALGAGFVPVRKPGKLPHKTRRRSYDLEYGTDALEMHADAVVHGARVVIVDDLLATGGTAAATIELVREIGGNVVGAAFVVELALLRGRERLGGVPVDSLLTY
jgi:adenine phosphoribosyltransferase